MLYKTSKQKEKHFVFTERGLDGINVTVMMVDVMRSDCILNPLI